MNRVNDIFEKGDFLKIPKPKIYEFYESYGRVMQEKILRFEEKITRDRDGTNKKFPIYMTRCRVKSKESAYLKTKRKGKQTPQEITDLVGIRTLCLFEQELIHAYKYILEYLKENSVEISEVIIYLVDKDIRYKIVLDEIFGKENIIKFEQPEKLSGYQSIHVTGFFPNDLSPTNKIPFEFQIRTLLQDVWAELEHKLGYKQKNKNKHIEQSFKILARDLKTNDIMLSYLFEHSEEFEMNNVNQIFNPIHVFKYDDDNEPLCFTNNKALQSQYEQYKELIYAPKFCESEIASIMKANEIFIGIKSTLENQKHSKTDSNVVYWIEMEEAFFYLLNPRENNDLIRAKNKYDIYWHKSYVASFRLGQMYAYANHFSQALMYFDNSLRLLRQKAKKNSTNDNIKRNEMFIHLNIALIYWLQGYEFWDIIIKESIKAAAILDEIGNIEYYNKCIVLNSVTWYLSEIINDNKLKSKFLLLDDINIDKEFDVRLIEYQKTIDTLEDMQVDLVDALDYDTLAMCYFRKYQSDKGNLQLLEKSHHYILKTKKDRVANYFYYEPEDPLREHFKMIDNEYNRMITSTLIESKFL